MFCDSALAVLCGHANEAFQFELDWIVFHLNRLRLNVSSAAFRNVLFLLLMFCLSEAAQLWMFSAGGINCVLVKIFSHPGEVIWNLSHGPVAVTQLPNKLCC